MDIIKRFLEERSGAVAVEYALIAFLVAMTVITAWAKLEAYISNLS